MSNTAPFFDIIILFGGGYLLYSVIGMFTQNKIPGVLLSKGMEVGKDADVTGFVQAMRMPTLIMGLVAIASGVLGFVSSNVAGLDMIQFIGVVVSFVMLIAYGYLDVRAQKKYLKIK